MTEPCPLEADPALADDLGNPERPGAAAKSDELSPALELDSESADGDTVCEETVQVLAADAPVVPFTMANTAGELSAVEMTEIDCVLSSCQR